MKNRYTAKIPILLIFFVLGVIGTGYSQTPVANFSASRTSGCAPILVNFQDLSTGNPTSWSWSFGNGSTSSVQNPSTTYLSPGLYTVTLTASNASGSNTITRTSYIIVYEKPSVSFSASDTAGCAPLGVQFINNSTPGSGNTIASVDWDLGNGASTHAMNPYYIYGIAGNFSVTLIVVNDKGCVSALNRTQYIRVAQQLIAGFNFSTPGTCRGPYRVNFTNTTTGPAVISYQWSFGDGSVSSQPNPTHQYINPGTYTVRLIANSTRGCSDTIVRNVVIAGTTTSFNTPDTVCVGRLFLCQNSSTPAPQSAAWNFGDGTSSALISPVKSYNNTGSYTIRLINTYANCTDSARKTVVVLPKPTCDFTGSPRIRCSAPLTVNFTDQSFNGAISWRWKFGDGTTSTLKNPTHTYTSNGNFTVTLVVTNAQGCSDSLVRTNYIRVQPVSVGFNNFNKRGCAPLTITPAASITSVDAITGVLWNFGNGATSTQNSPTYTYTHPGNYIVTLTVTTSTGCSNTFQLPDTIKVGTRPQISFNATPNMACVKQPITFTSTTNPADQWLWLFGDGGTSNLPNPSYGYVLPGTFNVTLYAWNNGCKDSLLIPQLITINPPAARFRSTQNCVNKTQVNFTDQSIGALTWFWQFGDGNTSTLQNPSHTYAAAGRYNVTLIVTNGSCADTITQPVTMIDERPDFTINPNPMCKGGTARFTAVNVNPIYVNNYIWNFGNGNGATGNNVSQTYPNPGSYTIRLVTAYINGCRDTLIKPNALRVNGPRAGFTAPVRNGCAGREFQFIDSSRTDGVNPIVQYIWRFGDGQTQTYTNPPFSHIYANPGTFSVTLITIDSSGCSDTLTMPNYIRTSRARALFTSADTLSCPGAAVNFANLSSGTTLTNQWSFGEGGTSNAVAPAYAYHQSGIYTVTLKVTDGNACSDSLIRPQYIRVTKPVSRFEMSDSLSLCPPFRVNFTNQSSNASSVKWYFGDGSTTTLSDPLHFYTQVRVYPVELIAYHPKGCTDTSKRFVRIYDSTSVNFSYSPLQGCKPLQVNFTTNGANSAGFSYLWDFGNGITDSLLGANPQYSYTVFGNFTPRVIVKDQSGCFIALQGPDTIRIKGAVSAFAADKKLFCLQGQVRFSDSTISNDPVVQYAWDFGDGNIGTGTEPTHNYSQPGLYTVTHITTTQSGCTDTVRKTEYIRVVDKPHPLIGGDSTACINGFLEQRGELRIADTSAMTWQWQFPNGIQSDVQLPGSQQYMIAGRFKVKLIVTNRVGCTDTVYKNIEIFPNPSSQLPDRITKTAGTPLQIPASYSNNVVRWDWDKDSVLDCSTCAQPNADPKNDIMLYVDYADVNGCRNRDSILINVMCPGTNLFIPNTFSPNGDNSNDAFYPRGKGIVTIKLLRIFNRWGEVVFEKQNFPINDASSGWNGFFKGQKAASDVYVFQCQAFCENNQVINVNGNITLLR